MPMALRSSPCCGHHPVSTWVADSVLSVLQDPSSAHIRDECLLLIYAPPQPPSCSFPIHSRSKLSLSPCCLSPIFPHLKGLLCLVKPIMRSLFLAVLLLGGLSTAVPTGGSSGGTCNKTNVNANVRLRLERLLCRDLIECEYLLAF